MPILSWYDEKSDNKLIELIPVLKALSEVPDVRTVLTQSVTKDNVYLNEKSLRVCEGIMKEEAIKRLREKDMQEILDKKQ